MIFSSSFKATHNAVSKQPSAGSNFKDYISCRESPCPHSMTAFGYKCLAIVGQFGFSVSCRYAKDVIGSVLQPSISLLNPVSILSLFFLLQVLIPRMSSPQYAAYFTASGSAFQKTQPLTDFYCMRYVEKYMDLKTENYRL